MTELTINGKKQKITADPDTPLLWVLRDQLKLTGTKYGCGVAACGACTVHMNGSAVRSCALPISAAENANITTIEGLESKTGQAVQQAWQALDVVQCGYCQSGQIMSATALLDQNPSPSDDEINAGMQGNLCRCATYQRIKGAIHHASKSLKGGQA